jgi:hypothetical protein
MSGRRRWDILINVWKEVAGFLVNVWKEAAGYFDKCLEGGGGIF